MQFYISLNLLFRTKLKYNGKDVIMDNLVEEYLDDLNEGSATNPAGFFIAIGFLYAIFKQWEKRKEIENGYCKEYKGKGAHLDLCVYKKQLDHCIGIINQLQKHADTCSKTRKPGRCREKVRYYIDKYKKKALGLEKKIEKTKFKISKKEYKDKVKNIKQKQLYQRLGD